MQQILLNGVNLNDLLEKIGQLIDSKLEKVSPREEKPKQSTYLSRKEVASLLNITLPTLSEWIKLGILKAYKVGSRVLFRPEEVQLCIDKLALEAKPKGGFYVA